MYNVSISHALIGLSLMTAGIGTVDAVSPRAKKGPDLGAVLDPRDVVPIDLTIMPDGSGLPQGRGNVARGSTVYGEQCAACHGDAGAGGVGAIPRLTGGVGSLSSQKPVKTINSFWPSAPMVFDYIRKAMPPTAPQTLSANDIYAVTAYLLSIDGIVPGKTTLDAKGLANVQMPNRAGFRPQWSTEGKPISP